MNPYVAMSGAPLVVADPDAAASDDREQLEAQELCGASAATLYSEEINNR